MVRRQRLKQLGLEHRDPATAAGVAESYISQLSAGKKTHPALGRTDDYDKMGKLLGLPSPIKQSTSQLTTHVAPVTRREVLCSFNSCHSSPAAPWSSRWPRWMTKPFV